MDDDRDKHYYGSTESRFSAQIGLSASEGKFSWMIFHEDFRYGVTGGEVGSIEEGKQAAQKWLTENAKLDYHH
jgi:hypothetical protein